VNDLEVSAEDGEGGEEVVDGGAMEAGDAGAAAHYSVDGIRGGGGDEAQASIEGRPV
jgi:hypothetical protein